MPRNRFYAVVNSPEDNHDSVKRAINYLVSFLKSVADCRATIVVPSLGAVMNTVVPEALKELVMEALTSAREYQVGTSTLTLCGEATLDRGHKK